MISLLYLFRAFQARMDLTSRLRSLGSWQELAFSEKMKFFSTSIVVTMLGNYTQVLCTSHSASIIAIANHEVGFGVYEVVVGIGCFCAWATIVMYFDHTSEAYLLVNTLKRSARSLLWYLLGLLPIMLAYALLGMCWFWPTGYFLDIMDTLALLMCMMYGDSVAMATELSLTVNVFFAQLFWYSYMVLFLCVVQNIFISYIRIAFQSFKTHPVSLVDDGTSTKNQQIGLNHHPQSLKEKLTRTFHPGLRSNRYFKHIITNGFKAPYLPLITEEEENTQELVAEMEDVANEVVELMNDLKQKAAEDVTDAMAVARFKEIVTGELPQLFAEVKDSLG